MTDIDEQIDELRPWRYNHSHGGVHIVADNNETAHVHEVYGGPILRNILDGLADEWADPSSMRVLDLGCLEGHYSDILCSFGFGEVVAIDLSERHVARASFLLKDLKGYENITVIQGDVLDYDLIRSIGKFDLVLFHGLLYHLHSPILMFKHIEEMIRDKDEFVLLLSHQFHMDYGLMINRRPVAQVKVRSEPPRDDGIVCVPLNESSFDVFSTRLNVRALRDVLLALGYAEIVAYDTPGGRREREHYAGHFILSKRERPGLIDRLNKGIQIDSCRFYSWDGDSADSYALRQNAKAKVVRNLQRLSDKAARVLTKLGW